MPGAGGGGGILHIKMTGVLVRDFRKIPKMVPESRFMSVAEMNFYSVEVPILKQRMSYSVIFFLFSAQYPN